MRFGGVDVQERWGLANRREIVRVVMGPVLLILATGIWACL
jgi:hypothetical protein